MKTAKTTKTEKAKRLAERFNVGEETGFRDMLHRGYVYERDPSNFDAAYWDGYAAGVERARASLASKAVRS